MSLKIFCDFDGTVAMDDVTDRLLDRFALPQWRGVEAEWQAGRIGSRQCMARQVDLLRASHDALDALLDSLPVDPHFADFVHLADGLGAELAVVSDGLDYAIRRMLGRHGLASLPIFANRLHFAGGDRWRLAFPHEAPDCAQAAGTCKCRIVGAAANGGLRILVGDGRSDFCAAGAVDLVFAKDRLLQHCRANRLPHLAFTNFADAARLLDQLARRGTAGHPPASLCLEPA